MAVYTHVSAEALGEFLTRYDVGELVSAKGVAECRADLRGEDPAGSQIIAVREPARQKNGIHARKTGGIVPDKLGLAVQVFIDGIPRIVVAIAARKNKDADFHVGKFQFSKLNR